jgi:ribosomal protein S18 acetylase RimI-like enzyme
MIYAGIELNPETHLRDYLPFPYLKNLAPETRLEAWRREQGSPGELVSSGDGTDSIWLARRLEWDSLFFGREFYRLDLAWARPGAQAGQDLGALESAIRARGGAYAFGILPVECVAAVDALGQAGWSVIETRLTYCLEGAMRFHPAERYPVRAATAEDVPALAEVSSGAVNQFDRFHSDPFFSRADADALMKKWIHASVVEGFADRVLMPVEGPGAFMTVKYLHDLRKVLGAPIAQMVLSAVSPKFRGWYRKLVSESIIHLAETGADAIFLTTQAANKPVIHVWESLGFRLSDCRLVVRKVLSQ